MENMNNQGKTPQQYEDSMRFFSRAILGIIILMIVMVLFGGCTTTKKCCDKEHVITEMDGDRVINWYTCKNKGHESKRTN